jgi:HTH-type transcriptional regulator / antitoxin HipB
MFDTAPLQVTVVMVRLHAYNRTEPLQSDSARERLHGEVVVNIATMQDLRVLVKSRRKDLGLTQAALADKAGVSRRWVSMFESGHETAEVGRLLAVLEALDLHLLAVAKGASTPLSSADEPDRATGGLRKDLRDYDEDTF